MEKNVTEIIHPCFGKIRLSEKFSKILKLKPFHDLAFKSQLGSKAISTNHLNAKHTRLLHSIGVYHLTSLLLETCKQKFSNYIKVSLQDEEALLLASLGHDIGHLPFSHSLEMKDMKSHEEMTMELFEDYSDEINDIFGYDIVSKVIQIFQNNIKVKQQGTDGQAEEDLDILFIFSSLLVGTIDCDRMEYIITDRYMITGEKLDYRPIFDYITIVLLNNAPTVGFERDAVPIIENLLINRFEQYEQIYFDKDSTLVEIALKDYIRLQEWSLDEIYSFTEYDILSKLTNILKNPEEASTIDHRLAEIIILGNRENILFKQFTSEKEFNFFMDKIRSIAGKDFDSLWIKEVHKKNSIYDPKKNRVYIKDSDGVIKDITDVSYRITNLSIDYCYVMIDLDSIYGTDLEISQKLKSLFYDNPVEIEKKFILNDSTETESTIMLKNIISKIPGISNISEPKKVVNHDQYFIASDDIPKGIAMRLRKTTDAGNCYYIKFPADDGTSITKREEQSFPNCSSLEEFIELAEKFIKLKGFDLPNGLHLTEGVKIVTIRSLILAKVYDSIVEFVLDSSGYYYKGESKEDYMLECEIKDGDDLALWHLEKHIKNLGFIETNESKETRAKKTFGIE